MEQRESNSVRIQQPNSAMTASTIDRVSEDQAAKTIEFLRARLLSERSVSKAAREQARMLAMKVSELEQRIEFEIRSRKQLEKTRREMLSKYRGDLSESHNHLYDDSEELMEMQEDSASEQGSESVKLLSRSLSEPDSDNAASKESADKVAVLGSTHNGESDERPTLRENGTLGWARQRDDHFRTKSTRRSLKSFAHHSFSSTLRDGESPRRTWTGKSVRQIRVNKGNRDHSGASTEETETQNEGRPHNAAPSEGGSEMDMALAQQSKLMELFEEEEDAQRAWEKKFKEKRSRPSENGSGNNEAEHARKTSDGDPVETAAEQGQDASAKDVTCDDESSHESSTRGHDNDENPCGEAVQGSIAREAEGIIIPTHEACNNKISENMDSEDKSISEDGDGSLRHESLQIEDFGNADNKEVVRAAAEGTSSRNVQEVDDRETPMIGLSVRADFSKVSISSSQDSCSLDDSMANKGSQEKSETHGGDGDGTACIVTDDRTARGKFRSMPWNGDYGRSNLCSDASEGLMEDDSWWEERLKQKMRAEILSQMENGSHHPQLLHGDVEWQQRARSFDFSTSTRNASRIHGDVGIRWGRPESGYEQMRWEARQQHHNQHRHHHVSAENGLGKVVDVLRALQMAKQEIENSGGYPYARPFDAMHPSRKESFYYPPSREAASMAADPYHAYDGRGGAAATMAARYTAAERPVSRYDHFSMSLPQYAAASSGRADAMAAQQMNPWSLQEDHIYPPSQRRR